MKNFILLLVLITSCTKKVITINKPSVVNDTVIVDKIIISHQLKSFGVYDQTATMYYNYNHVSDSVIINKKNFSDTIFLKHDTTNYHYVTNKPIIDLYTKQMYIVNNKTWFIDVID